MQHEHTIEAPQLDKIKGHLRENRKTYLIGTGCFMLGVVLLRRPQIIVNNYVMRDE